MATDTLAVVGVSDGHPDRDDS